MDNNLIKKRIFSGINMLIIISLLMILCAGCIKHDITGTYRCDISTNFLFITAEQLRDAERYLDLRYF